MKRIMTAITLACVVLMQAYAQEFTSAQLSLRNQIKTYIAEEGYMPTIDSDGDIKFKREGTTYYVIVSKTNSNPMYVRLICSYDYGETTYTRANIAKQLPELSRYKGVKVALYNSSYAYEGDMYLNNAKSFTDVFNTLLDQIDSIRDELGELL